MKLDPIDEERILVLAPRGRDAQVIEQVLTKGGLQCIVCADYPSLLRHLEQPSAAALIAEEALYGADLRPLAVRLEKQPSWSDYPFIILTSKFADAASPQARAISKSLGNIVMLERPFNAETLRSAAASALRARRRQYQARSDLEERTNLNATLESRIAERTAELAQANDQLMREINERERAQMALVQTQKMEALGHLTSGISHDFNNLLSIIQGNADLINLLVTEEHVKRKTETIRKAAQQGAKLTGQLLAFSRAQPLDLRAFDLNQALLALKDLLKASLGSSVQIQLDLTPGIPYVKADLNQIEMAVLNLAINAKDAMRGSGTVTIQTAVHSARADLKADQDYAVISVKDTGEGINPQIIGKVFDPFFTTKPLGKGTGLGLSQVYGIANQSGGTAKIRSEVGIGTVVEIWLPLADTKDAAASPLSSNLNVVNNGKRACILVVEDEPQVRRFMVESLEMLGYSVMQAEDGPSGLTELSFNQPDLLITDFLMAGMNGAELAKQARHIYPGLPIIIATGYADVHAIEEVIDREMVLRKPFQLNDLAHRVRRALNTSTRPQQLLGAP